MITIVVFNDLQRDYHDVQSLRAVEHYLEETQPDYLVYNGDIFDFPGLTDKFLRKPEDRFRLEHSLEKGREMFAYHRSLLPTAKFIYIKGNHEERLDNYIEARADELAFLLKDGRGLELGSLIDAPKHGIKMIGPYGEGWEYNGFLIKHGDTSIKYASEKELRDEGTSGMAGHNHRGGSFFKSNRGGAHAWYHNFCLCNLSGPNQPPGYKRGGVRDWQQGFSVIHFDNPTNHKRRIFNVYPVVITDHRFIAPSGIAYKP